jgi:ribonuclease HI
VLDEMEVRGAASGHLTCLTPIQWTVGAIISRRIGADAIAATMLDGATESMKLDLIFDGGSLGNPGKGYGSFRITRDGEHLDIQELHFGDNITNNQAEYYSLIQGLKSAIDLARTHRIAPARVSIDVKTDSKLVAEQVNGRWKVRNEGLKPLCEEARTLLRQFGNARISWHSRKESVRVLGH